MGLSAFCVPSCEYQRALLRNYYLTQPYPLIRTPTPTLTQVDASDLSPGYYYLGFFNMDYYVHSPCQYELTLTMSGSPPNMFKPMMSIWMGVCFSIVLCVVLSFFKRMVFRNMQNQLRSTGELVRGLVFCVRCPPYLITPSSRAALAASCPLSLNRHSPSAPSSLPQSALASPPAE